MLSYLQDVLGISDIILNQPKKDIQPQVYIICDQDLGPEADQLLHKMIAAMKLPEQSYQIFFAQDVLQQTKAPVCILNFCLSKTTLIQNHFPQTTIFETDSPVVILKNPLIKKKVWQDLQKVMKFIKEEIEKNEMSS